jgi:ABC-type phosphate transport system permease subunit
MHAPIPADRPRLPATGIAGGLVRAGATLGALPVAGVLLAAALGLAMAVPTRLPWAELLGVTFLVAGGATLVALVLALPAAVHLHAFAGKAERRRVDAALAVAGATPPVVAGWFAATVAGPWLAAEGDVVGGPLLAAATLGVLLAPGAIRAAQRALDTVPGDLRTTCLNLGVAPGVTAWRVVVPAAAPRLWGASLRLLARALGDAMVALMAAGAARPLAAAIVDATEAVFALSFALLAVVALAAWGARRLEVGPAGRNP